MDNLTVAQRSHAMRQVRSKHSSAEVFVRNLVHGMGYRFRLHEHELPGSPDLVFPARRKVIFVHGCFWHGHRCVRGMNRPSSNVGYWLAKLDGNKRRDRRNSADLRKLGWAKFVVWECQLKREAWLRKRLSDFLRGLDG